MRKKKGRQGGEACIRNLPKPGFRKVLEIQIIFLLMAANFWCYSGEIPQSVCCSCYSWM